MWAELNLAKSGRKHQSLLIAAIALAVSSGGAQSASPVAVTVDWNAASMTSRTTITLQVVSNPPLRPGSPIHDRAWKSMQQLLANDARLALWYPYPRMAIAEIAPPTPTRTSWDFSYMDPLVKGFFTATAGHPTVLSIATIPQWMFKGDTPSVPADPNTPVWNYEQGNELRDPSAKGISEYYERVADWYINGGFRDESGVFHSSGYHFKPTYWEVFNEPEYEHAISPEQYTRMYDAITERLHRVDPTLKFTGMSLAVPDKGEAFFSYFLDSAHHAPGSRLDAVSYHFYALGKQGESDEQQASSFFAQSDHFIETVQKIEYIRARMSPATETQINEVGCIAAGDQGDGPDKMSGKDISPAYWNLCGAMFAYLAERLAGLGIQVVGASQLVGYPTQYPSVSLLDWNTGLPNTRYRALQLMIDNLKPGDQLIGKPANTPQLYIQPIQARGGSRLILLVNKTAGDLQVAVSRTGGSPQTLSREQHVDMLTGAASPVESMLNSDNVVLHGFSVMVAQVAP
jgi:hypothetical protein